jgi:peptidoglycan/LPS O-acetylase OafA/YrhL
MPVDLRSWPDRAVESAGAQGRARVHSRVEYLDGIRAIAVLAVLMYHATQFHFPVPRMRGGYIGVDIFFVLSGYVITSVLIRRDPRIPAVRRYAAFMSARFRRLYPALLGMLLAILVGVGLGWRPSPGEGFASVASWSAIAVAQLSAFALAREVSGQHIIAPTWTLSCEWLFYAMWPFALFAIARRPWAWQLTAAAAATIYMISLAIPARIWWVLPPARMAEILVGAAVSLYVAEHSDRPRVATRSRRSAVWAGIGALVIGSWAVVSGFGPAYPAFRQVGCPLIVFSAVALVAGGRESPFVARLLSWRPLAAVGRASYSLYLVHYAWVYAFGEITGATVSASRLLFAALGVCASTYISYRFLERPYLRRHGQSHALRTAALGTA